MKNKQRVINLYDNWYRNNRENIINKNWNLIDESTLYNPEGDKLRGLNIIVYLPISLSEEIDKKILSRIPDKILSSGWIIPKEGRHFTLLDIIPHNSGWNIDKIKSKSDEYIEVLDKEIKYHKEIIKVGFEGVFASTDGITIQGYPLNSGLHRLRDSLRKALSSNRLANLEKKKYEIETAHVALLKFTKVLNGKKLINIIDNLRRISLGNFEVKELVLNISPRYDKVNTIEIIKKYKIPFT